MNAALLFASRSSPEWQSGRRPLPRNDAVRAVVVRSRLSMEVLS